MTSRPAAGATEDEATPGRAAMLIEGFGLHQPLRPEQMTSFHTPEPDAFRVWHLGVPDLDPDTWTMTVGGLVGQPVTVTLSDLAALPQTTVTAVLECAGNPLHPRTPQRRVGNVTWTGVRLADLLAQVAIAPRARYLLSTGWDHGSYGGDRYESYEKDLPLHEALTGDALVATGIDGVPLSAERGGPARLVVPGYYGTNSVKWLGAMQLSEHRSGSAFTTRYYMDAPEPGDDGPPTPVWALAPNSVLVAPIDGGVQAGEPVTIWGWAWAADPVTAAEVSVDGGETWSRADLDPRHQRSWQRFSMRWTPATVGEHTLVTRAATTSAVQPASRRRNQVFQRQVFATPTTSPEPHHSSGSRPDPPQRRSRHLMPTPTSSATAHGIDVEQVRADTPGVGHRNHLNNAGAALMPAPVTDAVIGHLRRESEIGGYEAQAEAAERIDAVYSSVARLIGAGPDEIALADSATLAWQRVFYSLPFAAGDRILTTTAEFAANYIAYRQLVKRLGVRVDVIPDDPSGALDPAALETMLDDRVRLISITWVPTNGGLINPAAAVGRIARTHGISYLLDACQAVGQLPVDVEELGCDVLTATGRKFLRGPRGTGFACVRRGFLPALEPAFLDLFGAPWSAAEDTSVLRPDARRFETWENNYAARLGLGAAADYALSLEMDAVRRRCVELTTALRLGLAGLPGIHLRDRGTHRAAIITLTHDRLSALEMKARLSERGINVSVSPPGSTPVDAAGRQLPDLLRISPHYFNTQEEIDTVIADLAHVVS